MKTIVAARGSRLVPLLIEAVKAQQVSIEAQQESIQAQNLEIAALKTTVAELSGNYLYLDE